MAKKTMSNGKRDFRQWHRISYILLGVGFLMCAVSSIQVVYESPVGKIMSLLGIGFAFAFFAVNFLFYRCPKCRKPQAILGPSPMCRYCKEPFIDNKGKPIDF